MPLLGTRLSWLTGQCKQDLQHAWECFSCNRWARDSNLYSIDEMDVVATFFFSLFYYSDETYYHFVKTPDAKPLHFCCRKGGLFGLASSFQGLGGEGG